MKRLIAFWIACSIISFGAINQEQKTFAVCDVPSVIHTQRNSLGMIVFITVLGPAGLVAGLVVTNLWEHGFSFHSWATKDFKCVNGEAVQP